MSGRRTSLASLAGAKVETVPGHSDALLIRLPLPTVVPTPLNPRTDFGSDDELAELGESMRRRQLQPIVVVSRASYLKIFPEHTEHAGTAAYVIANGERRYRATRHVGLDAVEAIVREEVAATREDFLDAVLSENIDRKNFDPIEEAHAVQTMVMECGTATAAATRFRRSGAWVSQRVALLRLAPEMQALVRSGAVPVREARALATLPPEEQEPAWRDRQGERQRERQEARTARKESRSAPARHKQPDGVPGGRSPDTGVPSVPQGRGAPQAHVQEQPARGGVPAPASAPRGAASAAATPPAGGPTSVPGAPQPPAYSEPDVWADATAMAEMLVEAFGRVDRKRIAIALIEANEREEEAAAAASVPA